MSGRVTSHLSESVNFSLVPTSGPFQTIFRDVKQQFDANSTIIAVYYSIEILPQSSKCYYFEKRRSD